MNCPILFEGESILVKAIVGANWGDEGKGKITDLFSEASDMIIRFQGGANAGHTIICDYGKFALHQLPSGVFYPHTTNVIGNGVALNIPSFLNELQTLKDGGVPEPNIVISERAQLLMPYHILQDTYEEERLAGQAFGSTKSGIAPFYSDKYAKYGIQVADLFHESHLLSRLEAVCDIKNVLMKHLYNKPTLDPKQLCDELLTYRDKIAPYVGDAFKLVQTALAENKNILLEGQLGAMKDPDFGIYPFTTSSHTIAGFAPVGAGIPPMAVTDVVAITKAYSSAVGSGAFTSEIFGEEADTLRRLGGDAGEFGATTGRPRRVGWFDTVATKFGCAAQGATQAVLTAIDVLGYLDEIKVCVAYEVNGKITDTFPVPSELDHAKPVYETLPGWKSDIRGETNYDALPNNAKAYVNFIEEKIGVPITMVSTGPKRHEITNRL